MEHLDNFDEAAPVGGHSNLLDLAATETATADELRTHLDGIYDKAFAKAPKPAQFAKMMADAKQVYDQWVKSTGNDNLSCFNQDIAEKKGLNLRTVQRLVERGNKVHPDVLDLVIENPKLNKGTVLSQIAKQQGLDAQLNAFETILADSKLAKPNTDEQRAKDFLKKFDELSKAVQYIVLKDLHKRLDMGAV